jgi:dihydroorotate dehydrogenase electron transfer subunit
MSVAPLGRRLVEISESRRLGAYVVIGAGDPHGPAPDPGQFYMLAAEERWGGGEDERPFLPRAFSVLRAEAGTLRFMLEDVGPGTRRLGELRAGEELWIAGPFGNGFTPPREGRRALLVGGGVGTAPLAILQDAVVDSPRGLATMDELAPGAPSSAARRVPARAMLGFRDAHHAEGAALLADARIATDDGSVGHAGPVTDLLLAELGADPHVEVYACGPPGMLEAVRAICVERAIPAQLAMESGMACGYGACFGCVVETKAGYVRLCVDGPVLEAATL